MSRNIDYGSSSNIRNIDYTSLDNVVSEIYENSNKQTSSGIVSGLDISHISGTDIAIALGRVVFKVGSSDDDDIEFYDISAVTSYTLTINTITYVYLTYNSGAPTYSYDASLSNDVITKILVGRVLWDGTTLHMSDGYIQKYSGFDAKMFLREIEEDEYRHSSGAISSASGLKLIITAGVFWSGVTRVTTSAIDTSGSDTFSYLYGSSGSFTEVTTQTDINNTQYDNSGVLTAMTAGYYRADYIYITDESAVTLVLGKAEYATLTECEDEAVPDSSTYLNEALQSTGIFIGKLVILKSAATPTSVKNPYENTFNFTGATTHGNLAGLSADDHTQYALLVGRATGQTLIGGTASGDDLTLQTTSDASKGSYIFSDVTTATRLAAFGGSKEIDSTDLVSWVDGTANQITVTDDTDGTITLSTPQDIHSSATPTFASISTDGISEKTGSNGVSIENISIVDDDITGLDNIKFLNENDASKILLKPTTHSIGTDASDNMIFNIPTGEQYDFQINSVSTFSISETAIVQLNGARLVHDTNDLQIDNDNSLAPTVFSFADVFTAKFEKPDASTALLSSYKDNFRVNAPDNIQFEIATVDKTKVTTNGIQFDQLRPLTANGDITIDVLDAGADGTLIITNSDGTYDAQIQLNGTTAIDGILDEDNMASDSATSLCTQQSIKKYVDDEDAAADTHITSDGSDHTYINQDVTTTGTPSFTSISTDQIQPKTANGDITIDVLDAGADSTLIITNSDGTYDTRIQLNGTTAIDAILDEDNMASDSATSLCTQQSIKKYVDDEDAAADTHISSNGSDHSYINQDVTTTGTPSFTSVSTDQIQPKTANGNITIDVLDTAADSTLVITNSDGTYDTQIQLNGTTAIDAILDEDNMASDSATSLCTQQSIKKYVDDSVATENLWNGDGTTLTPASTETVLEIDTIQPKTANGDITIDALDTAAASTINLTNSDVSQVAYFKINGSSPSINGIVDEDNMSSDSPFKLATQQSIKAYADSVVDVTDTFSYSAANKQVYIGSDSLNPAGRTRCTIQQVDTGNDDRASLDFMDQTNTYSLFQIMAFTHDNIQLLFDSFISNNIAYSSDAGSNFRITKVSDQLLFQVDSSIAAGSAVTFQSAMYFGTDRIVYMPAVYDNTTSTRDVFMDAGGELGYDSSLRAHKTNIENLNDVSWIYKLKPKKFNYRRKLHHSDGTIDYLEEFEQEKQYGFIAEDVEEVNNELCFYESQAEVELRCEREGIEPEEAEQKLLGIKNKAIVAALVKIVKQQKLEIDALKARLTTLESYH